MFSSTVTIKEIEKLLSEEFNLICLIDLAELTRSHSYAFELLHSLHKPIYTEKERLVFYSGSRPPQQLLDHLQRAASSIDISNWFILIICPEDISEDLRESNRKFGNDSRPMGSKIFLLESTRQFLTDTYASYDTMCALPFTSLDISQDKKLIPCCKFQGNLNENNRSWQSSFQGIAFQNLRQEFKQGKKPKACKECWHSENGGTTSLRQLYLEKFSRRLDREFIDNPKILNINYYPSTLCNFKCRICNWRVSSSIAAEELRFSRNQKKIFGIKQHLKEYNQSLDDAKTELLPVLHTLEYLHIMGGEPFMWPGLDPLLDYIIQSGQAHKIQLEFNTNGSVFPTGLEKWAKHFKGIEILLSIDDLGPRFEIQRGGSWKHINSNIQKFCILKSRTVTIKIAATVNVQNLLYLDQLVEYAAQHDLPIVWHYLKNPDSLCIDNVTQQVKNIVIEKYQNHSCEELRSISNRIQSTSPIDGNAFLSLMAKFDQRRKQKFVDSHKEIVDAMSQKT